MTKNKNSLDINILPDSDPFSSRSSSACFRRESDSEPSSLDESGSLSGFSAPQDSLGIEMRSLLGTVFLGKRAGVLNLTLSPENSKKHLVLPV